MKLEHPYHYAVRTGHGTTDWFQIGKGVHQGCILSPCLFNLYAEYIMQNAEWMYRKLELRLLGDISITSNMQMTQEDKGTTEDEMVGWHHQLNGYGFG